MRKAALAVAGLVVLFVVAGGFTAQAFVGGPVHKSYVCKYVGTPFVDERLQTGKNPIWVDNHALLGHDGTTFVGQEFTDKHGRSVVIVANTPKLDPEPSIGDCPAPQGPPGGEVTASVSPPSCDDPAFTITVVNGTESDVTVTVLVNTTSTPEVVAAGETLVIKADVDPTQDNSVAVSDNEKVLASGDSVGLNCNKTTPPPGGTTPPTVSTLPVTL